MRNKTTEAPPSWWDDLLNGTTEDSQRARQSLILHYQFLVEAIARKLHHRLPSWIIDEDLISYGQIGLIKAVDRYDPTIGPFRSFASTYVHGAIMDELRSQDRAPRGLRREQQNINKAVTLLRNGNEEAVPGHADVAEALGWTTAKLTTTQRKITTAQIVSLDATGGNFDERRDGVAVDSSVSVNILCLKFVDIFNQLPYEAQIILARKYYLQETMTLISEQTGLSPSAVREIHSAAIRLVYEKIYAEVS